MMHNLAHIELNAIDLAWDTVVRYASSLPLPTQFAVDFARVAFDESRHLSWCLQRLEELGPGCEYGCLPAHGLLWQGCAASSGDLRARLAVVPMSQEAKGLDAGQRLVDRLRKVSHSFSPTPSHLHPHADPQTSVRTHTHTHTHTQIYTQIYTHTHTQIYNHTHTHT